MCIIILSPPNTPRPSASLLDRALAENPHGAGVAWGGSGKAITWHKGLLTRKEIQRIIRHASPSAWVAVHARWATSGGVSAEMAHPFPITADVDELRAAEGRAYALAFHNGVCGQGDKDLSDTALAVRTILAPLGNLLWDKRSLPLLRAALPGRWLIMAARPHAHILAWGAWTKQANGLWLSHELLPVRASAYFGSLPLWQGDSLTAKEV